MTARAPLKDIEGFIIYTLWRYKLQSIHGACRKRARSAECEPLPPFPPSPPSPLSPLFRAVAAVFSDMEASVSAGRGITDDHLSTLQFFFDKHLAKAIQVRTGWDGVLASPPFSTHCPSSASTLNITLPCCNRPPFPFTDHGIRRRAVFHRAQLGPQGVCGAGAARVRPVHRVPAPLLQLPGVPL
jgi:hypothetical protein